MTMMDDNTVGGSKLMMTGMSTTIDSSNVYVRGNLFDLSTPGLTPINPNGIANTTVTSDISMINPRPFGGLNDDTDTNNYTGTSKRINTNATSATNDYSISSPTRHHTYASNVTGGGGGTVPPLPLSSASSYVLKPVADSGRRVSFGPTARLSFSNVDNSSYAFDNSIADDEDEHPMKLQKMGLSHIDDIALTPANDTSIDHQKWNTTNSVRKDGAGLGLLDETTKTDNNTYSSNNSNNNNNNHDNSDSPLRAISLIAILATAYQYLCNYKCRDCIRYYYHYHYCHYYYYYYYYYHHYYHHHLLLPLLLLPLLPLLLLLLLSQH